MRSKTLVFEYTNPLYVRKLVISEKIYYNNIYSYFDHVDDRLFVLLL